MTHDKASIRKHIKLQRQKLNPEQCQQAARGLLYQFTQLNLPEFQHIAAYLSHNNEMDLKPLIEALWEQGKTCYLPLLHPFHTNELWFQPFHALTRLIPNRYGILEPEFEANTIAAAWELDIILMPLIAFDIKGNRLGMGAGCYDKSLAFAQSAPSPLLIGCAYQFQCLTELAIETWDIPMNKVITEQQHYEFSYD
ncbi:MAG: 5-formyltetrahydrofolate cyclo-ligase [Gammaproteobacteria bacterium]|nr:5-formyltetrahydrofolate cyclo-ligase [Gammaproteobacteria bacterium]